MPRFVILEHNTPHGVHFDLMLEADGVLKTWSLPRAPSPGVVVECDALGDHRLEYLDYEGPISGGRGSVARWDQGHYTIKQQNADEWRIELAGEKAHGAAHLHRLPGVENRWSFSFGTSPPI